MAHPNNITRLDVLHDLGALDSGAEKVYDEITQLTAELCNVPVCLISLVEEDRQWFKSKVGLGIGETSIEQSICAHAITQNDYLEIPDTHLDHRTLNNSLCLGDKPFRFYSGAILRTLEGWPLGTLCVLDYEPRQLSLLQKRVLEVHAKSVTRQLELTRALVKKAEAIWGQARGASNLKDKTDKFKKTYSQFETLTPREKEVVSLIAGRSGNLSSKEIARELNISHRTVDHHRAKIMTKMDVGSIAELIAVILKAGIFED